MTRPVVTRPDLDGVVDAYRRLLDVHTPHVVGAFLYGSIVTRTTPPSSDVDCFVLVTGQHAPHVAAKLRREAAELQQVLGYTPDPGYPIEVFTPGTCRLAIGDARTRRWCARATRTGNLPSLAQDGDAVEILHALLSPSRILCGHEVVTDLPTPHGRWSAVASLEGIRLERHPPWRAPCGSPSSPWQAPHDRARGDRQFAPVVWVPQLRCGSRLTAGSGPRCRAAPGLWSGPGWWLGTGPTGRRGLRVRQRGWGSSRRTTRTPRPSRTATCTTGGARRARTRTSEQGTPPVVGPRPLTPCTPSHTDGSHRRRLLVR